MMDKRFARMDKVKLLELLCQLTEENETLKKRMTGMEEANAELMLKGRELEARADEACARAQKCEDELRQAEEARQALPAGNFADSLMGVYEIAQRTQKAADEYMAACQRKAEDAQHEAEAALIRAREEADVCLEEARKEAQAVMEKAQAQADATFREAQEHLAQKTQEAEELLRQAQERAQEEIGKAEERCRAAEQKESEIRQRLKAEIEGLNRMVARLDGDEA